MKLFGHYLKDRLFFIMIYVVSVLICLCVFKLYNLELEAFTYAFMILCVLLVVCFLFDWWFVSCLITTNIIRNTKH